MKFSASKTRNKIHQIRNFILLMRDHINGELAYQNHLKYCKEKGSKNEKLIDRKTFLRNREKSRWDKVNRCC